MSLGLIKLDIDAMVVEYYDYECTSEEDDRGSIEEVMIIQTDHWLRHQRRC